MVEIQKQIVEKLSAAQEYKKQLLEQKEKLKELFDSVLHTSMNPKRAPKKSKESYGVKTKILKNKKPKE